MKYYDLSFEEICISGFDAWVCNVDFSALVHVDLKTMQTHTEYIFDENNPMGAARYTALAYHNEKLIIAPNNGSKDILIYDVKEHSILKRIDIEEYVDPDLNQLFKQVLIRENKAYLIPGRSKKIVIVDLQDYSLATIDLRDYGIDDWIEENGRILFRHACFDDKNLIVPCFQTGKVLSINVDEDFSADILDFGEYPLTDVCVKDGYYYFSVRNDSKLVKHCTKSGEKEIISLSLTDDCYIKGISRLIEYGTKIIAIPNCGNVAIAWDTERCNSTAVMQLDNELSKSELVNVLFNIRGSFLLGNRLVCYNNRLGRYLVYDLAANVSSDIRLTVDDRTKSLINERIRPQVCKDILYENDDIGLDEFLELNL